jgi:hypothetical protein
METIDSNGSNTFHNRIGPRVATCGFPMKNARPVTPADLVKWGWEDEEKVKAVAYAKEGVCPICHDGILVKAPYTVDGYRCVNGECGACFEHVSGGGK